MTAQNRREFIKNASPLLALPLINVKSFFTTSPDLTAEFPAKAARERIKWNNVPLMCSHEMDKNGALQKCIRILIMWNTNRMQNEISHAYLKDASILRPDIL